jgi:hypothetical protein
MWPKNKKFPRTIKFSRKISPTKKLNEKTSYFRLRCLFKKEQLVLSDISEVHLRKKNV